MNVFSIAGFAIISCVLVLLIEQYLPQYKPLVLLGCGCVLLLFIATGLFEVVDTVKGLSQQIGEMGGSFKVLIQCLGIGLITQIACDTCLDSGQKSLAGKVELAGKVAIVLLLLPTIQAVLEKVSGVLGMI